MVVLIPKGGGEYLRIGLVEVVCKAVAVILNSRFTASITYHDSLHGLWAGRSTRTATLEVKLLQQVTAMREALLHEIFLDLHKAYDTFYRSRFMEILEGYGVGTRALRLLWRYWEWLQVVARGREVTTDNPSTEREASHRGIHCRPPSSMWWWTQWSATGSPWWANRRGGGEKR